MVLAVNPARIAFSDRQISQHSCLIHIIALKNLCNLIHLKMGWAWWGLAMKTASRPSDDTWAIYLLLAATVVTDIAVIILLFAH